MQGIVKRQASTIGRTEKVRRYYWLAALVTAIITIGIASKSSPLYPFNDWVDANCYLTIGRSMLRSLVPYRDLFEQKGPLLYMLHALAALVSDTSFLGVYFLEVLAATLFLAIGYRTLCLTMDSPSLLWLPAMAGLTYGSIAFFHGDSAEEFCLPLIAYGIYCGLRAVKEKEAPHAVTSFLIGITSACVLWIKFSMLGVYLGWFLALAIVLLRNKQLLPLLKTSAFIVLGVAVASLPVLLYFLFNGALDSLWSVYFYDNLFLYSSAPSGSGLWALLRNFADGLFNLLRQNTLAGLLAITAGVACIIRRQYRELLFLVATFAGLFALVYVGHRHYAYYALIFGAFVPFGLNGVSVLNTWLNKLRKNYRGLAGIVTAIVPLLCAGYILVMSNNTYMLKYEKAAMPQHKFAEIMQQKDTPTMLNYGFLDGGFYTTAGIIPKCRYFCRLNLPKEEMLEGQQACIDAGEVDFVVTRDTLLEQENYRCIAQADFPLEGKVRQYYLYERTE